MERKSALESTIEYVKSETSSESTSHDWLHVMRVDRNAQNIAKYEGGDLFIIRMASLLHDIGDMKLHGGDTSAARRIVGSWLNSIDVERSDAEHILYIIDNMSFYKSLANGKDNEPKKTIEFMVVQDADRLEAIGAMGIARAFHYGGAKTRKIYDPHLEALPLTAERYKEKGGSKDTITHFNEKLFGLYGTLNTRTAKIVGMARHELLISYYNQFFAEWNETEFDIINQVF